MVFGVALAIDSSVGAVSSRIFKVDPWKNAFGTCVKGGVDATLLVTALTATVALIGGFAYSATAIGIVLLSIAAPLLFRLRAPIVKVDQTGEYKGNSETAVEPTYRQGDFKDASNRQRREDEPVRAALKKCLEQDARAVVVVNASNKPIGTLLLGEALSLSNRQLKIAEGV